MRRIVILHIDREAQIEAIGRTIEAAVRKTFASLTNEQIKALVESPYGELRMDLSHRKAA